MAFYQLHCFISHFYYFFYCIIEVVYRAGHLGDYIVREFLVGNKFADAYGTHYVGQMPAHIARIV